MSVNSQMDEQVYPRVLRNSGYAGDLGLQEVG